MGGDGGPFPQTTYHKQSYAQLKITFAQPKKSALTQKISWKKSLLEVRRAFQSKHLCPQTNQNYKQTTNKTTNTTTNTTTQYSHAPRDDDYRL